MEKVAIYEYAGTLKDYDGSRIAYDTLVANIKLTPHKVVDYGNGYDEGCTGVQYARIPRGVDAKQLANAVAYSIAGYSGCNHVYDCCGCAHYSVFTKLIGKRKLLVRTKTYYNY